MVDNILHIKLKIQWPKEEGQTEKLSNGRQHTTHKTKDSMT